MALALTNQNDHSLPASKAILLRALQNPELYDHPVDSFTLLETHISWVLLTGQFAYKIKKPVNLGFVDFSTLAKRQFYCAEELRLNSRQAPEIYLQEIVIHGSNSHPHFGGEGKVIEYAIKMKQFAQSSLLNNIAAEKHLESSHIDAIADEVIRLHRVAKRADTHSSFGKVETVLKWSEENFEQIESAFAEADLPTYFDELKVWCLELSEQQFTDFEQRLNEGQVRECHGDLHLGNIALIDGHITLFDCIEFNPELRWIDTISDLSFIAMDLYAHGYSGFCWRLINRYLANSGDYQAIEKFNYYFVYRAMVRAKVAALRANQLKSGELNFDEALRYMDLAQHWINQAEPAIIIMHGLSGSGKSTLAAQLLESLGAIHLRSDIERKRLFELSPVDNSNSLPEQGIYNENATRQTYDRLAELCKNCIQSGFNAIVDASFLKRRHRDQFKNLAEQLGVGFLIINCTANENLLADRIRLRQTTQLDPSEATVEVLQRQMESQDEIADDEQAFCYLYQNESALLSDEQFSGIRQIINR